MNAGMELSAPAFFVPTVPFNKGGRSCTGVYLEKLLILSYLGNLS